MASKSIYLNLELLRALMRGHKTQTRKIVKSKYDIISCKERYECFYMKWAGHYIFSTGNKEFVIEPKYNVNDILWVRENWGEISNVNLSPDWPGRPHVAKDIFNKYIPMTAFIYRSDGVWQWVDSNGVSTEKSSWMPPKLMPKEAVRVFLKVTDVRVEKLQDISEEDAIAEGIQPLLMSRKQFATTGQLYRNYLEKDPLFNEGLYPVESFQSLWQSIHGPESWEKNPFVWVYMFEVVEKPENF